VGSHKPAPALAGEPCRLLNALDAVYRTFTPGIAPIALPSAVTELDTDTNCARAGTAMSAMAKITAAIRVFMVGLRMRIVVRR
jgi:hypothetical protein